jgi:hypothetical protein
MADKTVVLNVRVTELQAEWLRKLADLEHAGNLSAAARRTLSDSWMLRRVREEYQAMVEQDGFSFPRHEDGMSRGIEFMLSRMGQKSEMRWTEEDVEWI